MWGPFDFAQGRFFDFVRLPPHSAQEDRVTKADADET